MKILRRIFQLIPVIFLLVAIWLIHSQLQNINFKDFLAEIRMWNAREIDFALLFTALNFLVLSGYDFIGLAQAGVSLPFWKVFSTSFSAFSVSNIVGHSLFSGTSIRVESYSKVGVPVGKVTQVSIQNTITFWLGYLFLSGITLLIHPKDSKLLGISVWGTKMWGSFFLFLVLLYIILSWKSKIRFLKIWMFEISLPSFLGSLANLFLSSLDLLICAGVLFVLLPQGMIIGYTHFLTIYLVANLAGLISQIPGGLGVLDGILLKLLSQYGDSHKIMVSIILFRLIYYALPLLITVISRLTFSLWKRRQQVAKTADIARLFIEPLIPQSLAILTAFGGLVLIGSGVIPAINERMQVISKWIPFPIIEISHLMGSVVGFGLLLLAREVWRKNQAAFRSLIILLLVGAVASLAKGLDYEEALVLLIIALILLPFKSSFYRKAPLFSNLGIGKYEWTLGIILIFATILGFFAYTEVPYSHDLWFTFAPHEDAPRFMRSMAVLLGLFFVFIIREYTKGPIYKLLLPTAEELSLIKNILKNVKDTEAQLVLLGDKYVRISSDNKAFLMFGVQGNSWIVLGEVYGEKNSGRILLESFMDEADRYGTRIIFYQLAEEFIPVLLEAGLYVLKLGEEAHIPLQEFNLEGSNRKELRGSYRRGEREGVTFRIMEPPEVALNLNRLKEVSDIWLKKKNVKEKGFSLGVFKESYLRNFPCAVIEKENKILAFANLFQGSGQELSVDLMRYNTETAPKGVMDFLFVSILLWGKEKGFKSFNLGMAPLSGITLKPWSSLWYKLAHLAFRHGEHFYNFQGLRDYKEKYDPIWKSRYVGSESGLPFAQSMADVAILISGGFWGIVGRKD
ncbi:MAG: bifunctional lysylphosphatidylglycerol flippase/synthetase MprF [Bacteriovoracales bacterium]